MKYLFVVMTSALFVWGCKGSDSAGAAPSGSDSGTSPDLEAGASLCAIDAGPTGVPACDTCTEARCCEERTACLHDPGCKSYVDCARACTRQYSTGGPDAGSAIRACVVRCAESAYDAAVAAQSWTECVRTECNAECP